MKRRVAVLSDFVKEGREGKDTCAVHAVTALDEGSAVTVAFTFAHRSVRALCFCPCACPLTAA